MAILASDVMAGAAVLLNDAGQRFYTNSKLLPYVKKVYRDLEQLYDLNGLRSLDEISTDILVTAGSLTVTAPSDLVYPIKLEERTPNSTEEWIPMTERRWEPDLPQGPSLNYWVFREEQIQLVGASQDREVRVFYKKSLSPVTGDNSVIALAGSQSYLESHVAALASKFIGENYDRGKELDLESGLMLNALLGINTKSQQGRPVRRKRFGSAMRRITS